MPKPETRREFALSRIMPSWWHFTGALALATAFFVTGGWAFFAGRPYWRLVPIGFVGAAILFGLVALARRGLSWSITSERLIERRGILASRRREVELADIRSVEVDRRFMQRLLGIGNVLVSTAASADFLIKLEDVADPDMIAETLRQARLKRLA